MSHEEARQRAAASQRLLECKDDACRNQAKEEINRLDALDKWRDQQVADACRLPASDLCKGWYAALADAKQSYQTSYVARNDVNQWVAGERRQVNEQEFLFRQRINNPLAFGVAKGLMKLTPPAVVLGVGLTTYEVTTAVKVVGAVDAALAIASGLRDLPGELRARLNSEDPTIRGEALVDTLAIAGASTAIVGRLQQTGSKAITAALEKQAAIQAEARAVASVKTEANIFRDGSVIEYGNSIASTNPNEAVFWSGRTNGVGGQAIAAELAEKYRGLTLEQLIERRQIDIPAFERSNPSSVEAWTKLSFELAKNTKGEVRVVLGSEARKDSIWNTVELPALMFNPSVTRVVAIDPATKLGRVVYERVMK